MSPRVVLQVCPLLASLQDRLTDTYEVVRLDQQPDRAAYLAEHGADVAVAVTSARYGVSDELMDALPNLGAIVHFGVGYETTDVARARARDIDVSNTPDVLTDCVADLAVGALIDVQRRLAAADRYVRRGDWTPGGYPLTTKVSGKHVGILGLGRIGRAIARRLEGFDTRLSYHSRRPVADVRYAYVSSPVELAERVDALIVATAGGPATRDLVDAEVLRALGSAGFLVNVSRGSVVDEPALVSALTAGELGGAALDVFADEPHVPNELLGMDNVLLLPHIASATRETREAMGQLTFRNVEAFLAKGELVTPVPAV